MDVQFPIVLNEPQLPKLIHEETDSGRGGVDHLGERLLADLRNDRLRLTILPEMCQQQQQAREPLLAGIKEPIYQILFDAHAV